MPPLFIADSDDDDDGGYSPPPKPRVEKGVSSRNGEATHSSDRVSHVTASTDPAFFQSVFDEQNDLVREHAEDLDGGGARLEHGKLPSSGVTGPENSRPTESDQNTVAFTSLTDPTAEKGRQLSSGRVTNELTQVTTPGRGGTRGDPYDIPSSPETGRIGNKAKPANSPTLSLVETTQRIEGSGREKPAPGQDESTGRSKKRRKTERSRHHRDQDAVDLITMPVSQEPDTVGQLPGATAPSSHLVSTLPADSDSSLFIVQKTLTASQRQQYQSVGLPSSDGPPPSGWLLRGQNYHGTYQGSSGSATNVNTPRSEDKPLHDASELEFERQMETGTNEREEANCRQRWSSSPDVISAVEPTATGGKVGKRTPKKGGTKVPCEQQQQESLVGEGHAAYRAKTGGDDLRADDEDDSDYNVAAPKAVQQKRPRGRPKKKTGSDGAPATANPPVSHVADEEPARKEKKKRGRPRKSAVQEGSAKGPTPPGPAELDSCHEPNTCNEEEVGRNGSQPEQTRFTSPQAEEKEPRQQALEHDKEEEGEEDGTSQHGIAPKTPASRRGSGAQAATDASWHGQEKATAGSRVPSGSGSAKPLYRVGLSKRSRIAPLLKMVRK